LCGSGQPSELSRPEVAPPPRLIWGHVPAYSSDFMLTAALISNLGIDIAKIAQARTGICWLLVDIRLLVDMRLLTQPCKNSIYGHTRM